MSDKKTNEEELCYEFGEMTEPEIDRLMDFMEIYRDKDEFDKLLFFEIVYRDKDFTNALALAFFYDELLIKAKGNIQRTYHDEKLGLDKTGDYKIDWEISIPKRHLMAISVSNSDTEGVYELLFDVAGKTHQLEVGDRNQALDTKELIRSWMFTDYDKIKEEEIKEKKNRTIEYDYIRNKNRNKMKVNLEKELDSEKKKSITQAGVVSEAKMLLEGNYNKERELLKRVGLGHTIIEAEKNLGANIERSKFEQEFEGKVFTEDEIKNLALDYDLRFLSSRYYKGNIDLQLGSKIKNFFEKHKLNENDDHERFYILAPKKAFNLEERPKPANIDPVIFYKPSRNDDKYLLVHSWGNDFSVFRLIRGLMTRSAWSSYLTFSLIATCFFQAFLGLFNGYHPIQDFFVSLPIALIAVGIGFLIKSEGGEMPLRFNNEEWNSTYRD